MPSAPDLSIIIPTCNRAPLLAGAINALAATVQSSYEIIVVDGASEDNTPHILRQAQSRLGDRLKIIREDHREGFVKAANKGFRAATGRCLTWLNDDARPVGPAYDTALRQLAAEPPDVAFLALFHRWASPRNIAYEVTHASGVYRLCHVRGTLYANFALGLRQTFEDLNFLDEQFYFYAADPDLSLKAWQAGLRVVPAWGALIDHEQHEDARRQTDNPLGHADNQKLFAKWNLPAINPHKNDFDPNNPCTLPRPAQQISSAA